MMWWIARAAGRWLLIAGLTCAAALISWRVAARSASAERASDAQPGKKTQEDLASGVLSGRVVTPDGKPVKGAVVSWVGRTDREALVLATVMTDDAGLFAFSNAAQLRGKDAYPKLMVEAAGWGLSFRDAPVDDEPLGIELVPPTELRVSFLDREGKPISDLPVRPGFFVGGRHSFLDLPPVVAERLGRRTDREGRVTISGLPQGHQLRLAVPDDRFAHLTYAEQIHLGTGPATEVKPIRLLPAASIQGKVIFGPTGKPAAGVRVGAQSVDGGDGWGEAVTGADGSYHIQQLRPTAYNVALDLKGELAKEWTARAHERLPVAAGERLEGKDFTLIRGAVITGKVTAADNGKPVSGLHIGVYGPAHPRSGAWVGGTQSGPDGRYRVRVPGGKQYLYIAMAELPGFILPRNRGRDLSVQDGETVRVDFQLPRGGSAQPAKPVRGRVLGPDGKPVAGAEVVASAVERFAGESWPIRADAEGRFRLSERMLSQPVTLRAKHSGMATTSAILVTGGEDVTLRLKENALVSLSGRVTDAEGRPMAGAQVRLIEWVYDSGHDGGTAATDDQGRYAFSGLWPDVRYSVSATAEGHGENYTPTLALEPGQSQGMDPIVLRKADRSVAGRVVDAKGDPQARVRVQVSGRESRSRHVMTDSEGRFRCDGLVEESLELWVGSAALGEQPVRKRVKAGDTDVILVFTGGEQTGEAGINLDVAEQFDLLLGRPAPPLNAVAWVNAKPGLARELRGKVVLIDFWGIGCGPCVAALPGVQAAADQFNAKGAVVIGLHDSSATLEQLQAFAKQRKLTYPLAIDTTDEQKSSPGKTFRAYRVQGVPAVAVIDREGRVAYLGHSLGEALGRMGALLGQ